MKPAAVANGVRRPCARHLRRLDHDRPYLAGRFDQGHVARRPLADRAQRRKADFNSYGSRRGNHEVMMRGTFANVRIKNLMVREGRRLARRGGITVHQPTASRCRSTTPPCAT